MRAYALALCAVLLVACGPGEEGPAGPQGPKGDPGPGVSQAVEYQCTGGIQLASGARYFMVHLVYVFPDGGVMTQCTLADGVAGNGMFMLHRARDGEAATARCELLYDVDTASAGYWVFDTNVARTSSTVTYQDASSASNNSTYSIPCTRYAP